MLLLDAHVHIYRCFDLKSFFDHARLNFQTAAAGMGKGDSHQPVIVLSDWAKQRWFHFLEDLADRPPGADPNPLGAWTVTRTAEDLSLMVVNGPHRIWVIAGRKIISRERHEVLALGVADGFSDGEPLGKIVASIRDAGGVALVPWAVGKWLGNRGKVLKDLVLTRNSDFMLCDNGNRPWFWPRPAFFSLSERQGHRILAGSDPLHFASEARRVGGFGVYGDVRVAEDRPWRDLKKILESPAENLPIYGQLEGLTRFVANQFAMQVLKQKNRKELIKE